MDRDPTATSLATEALRRGRVALARSFRFHRPRGAFCHAGWCQQCKVRLADGRTVLACRAGPEALAQAETPSPWLRVIGRLAERVPPWFHEHRLLRPRPLRQAYLNLLRRLSGALPLPAAPADAAERPWRDAACDVLVVGGGLAGVTAAASLARAGADVLLVEAERLGGAARVVPALAQRLLDGRAALAESGARWLEGATALGLYDDATSALVATADGMMLVGFRRLVVATGAYDRLLAVPGNDLPGIVGVRAFERLARSGALSPALRIGVYAAAPELERALAAADGLRLAFRAGPESDPPVRLVRVLGRGRVAAVELDPGGAVPCDLLVLGFSQPGYEFQIQAGCRPVLAPDGATMLTDGAGTVPLLVVGEAAGERTPERAAAHAAAGARAWIGAAAGPAPASASASAFAVRLAPAHDDAMLCPCEDVRVRDVRRAMADGYRDIDLLKRRTGAGTGPCQGKLCHPELLRCLSEGGAEVRLPTVRPLVRPMALGAFLGRSDV